MDGLMIASLTCVVCGSALYLTYHIYDWLIHRK